MQVSTIMRTPPVTVSINASLQEAVELMVEHGLHAVAVVEEECQLVGVLTASDILVRGEIGTGGLASRPWWNRLSGKGLSAADYIHTHSKVIADIITREPVSVVETMLVEDAVASLIDNGVHQVPVVRGRRVVGMLSRGDVLVALAAAFGAVHTSATDDDIARRVRDECSRFVSLHGKDVEIEVKSGLVRLQGIVPHEEVAQAIRVATQNIAGADKVVDELVVLDAMAAASMILG